MVSLFLLNIYWSEKTHTYHSVHVAFAFSLNVPSQSFKEMVLLRTIEASIEISDLTTILIKSSMFTQYIYEGGYSDRWLARGLSEVTPLSNSLMSSDISLVNWREQGG